MNEQFNIVKVAAHIPVTQEVLDDLDTTYLVRMAERGIDRFLRPWAYPDRPPTWTFDPFPRWTKLCRFARRAKVWVFT